MKKNWKKIYKRLKRNIKDQIKGYQIYEKPLTRSNFVDEIELRETIYTLNNILSVMDELEGIKCHGILFTSNSFKNWKKSIRVV